MKRRARSSIVFAWHLNRQSHTRRSGVELFGNPSEAARRDFNYVIAIGKARCRPGHVLERAETRGGWLLHAVHRGEYWHRINGQEYHQGAGGVCLLDPSKPAEHGTHGARTASLWWVLLDGRELPRLITAMGVSSGRPVFDRVSRARFESLFRQLWDLMLRKPLAHEARAHAIIGDMLAELFISRAHESGTGRTAAGQLRLSEPVQAAIDFMTRRGHEQLGLKYIAQKLGLSVHAFTHRFRREVGMAPMLYLNTLRIDQARRLLTTTDKPVAEIGRIVGVPDPAYFSRLFVKIGGVSPRAHRRAAARERA